MTRPVRYRSWLCRKCGTLEQHAHMHDTAHGIEGTHMHGSERFVCRKCGTRTLAGDGEVAKQFPFKLDEVRS